MPAVAETDAEFGPTVIAGAEALYEAFDFFVPDGVEWEGLPENDKRLYMLVCERLFELSGSEGFIIPARTR